MHNFNVATLNCRDVFQCLPLITCKIFKLEKAILIFGHKKEAVMAPFKEVYKEMQKAT
jgi:hypothetical protein